MNRIPRGLLIFFAFWRRRYCCRPRCLYVLFFRFLLYFYVSSAKRVCSTDSLWKYTCNTQVIKLSFVRALIYHILFFVSRLRYLVDAACCSCVCVCDVRCVCWICLSFFLLFPCTSSSHGLDKETHPKRRWFTANYGGRDLQRNNIITTQLTTYSYAQEKDIDEFRFS